MKHSQLRPDLLWSLRGEVNEVHNMLVPDCLRMQRSCIIFPDVEVSSPSLDRQAKEKANALSFC